MVYLYVRERLYRHCIFKHHTFCRFFFYFRLILIIATASARHRIVFNTFFVFFWFYFFSFSVPSNSWYTSTLLTRDSSNVLISFKDFLRWPKIISGLIPLSPFKLYFRVILVRLHKSLIWHVEIFFDPSSGKLKLLNGHCKKDHDSQNNQHNHCLILSIHKSFYYAHVEHDHSSSLITYSKQFSKSRKHFACLMIESIVL